MYDYVFCIFLYHSVSCISGSDLGRGTNLPIFCETCSIFQPLPRICFHNSGPCFPVLFTEHNLKSNPDTKVAVIRTYHYSFKFAMLIQVMMSLSVINNTEYLVSVSHIIHETCCLAINIRNDYLKRKHPVSKKLRENMVFSKSLFQYLIAMVSVTWLLSIMLMSGDAELNPGPPSTSSTSNSIDSVLNQFHHLPFINYNVQRLLYKLRERLGARKTGLSPPVFLY